MEGGIVYQRGEADAADLWDDSALVEAYDAAMRAYKAAETGGGSGAGADGDAAPATASTAATTAAVASRSAWAVGDACRAVWSEDGVVYRAQIDSIDDRAGSCTVTFTDYGNSDTAQLGALLPPEIDLPSAGVPTAEVPSAAATAPTTAAAAPPLASPSRRASGSSERHTWQPVEPPAAPVTSRWRIGDACRCIYRVDGLVYPAVVLDVSADGRTYSVRFDGYGNEQAGTPERDIYPKAEAEAAAAVRHTPTVAAPAPSPYSAAAAPAAPQWGGLPHFGSPPRWHAAPPEAAATPPSPMDDSLASMLMSWYQSGFHTGYYLAQQELRRRPY
mmetsp:Transcript_20026/g.52005  ORF Transcript_20026/g.52005 Transcript_20026/m.52005 type:complete len:331 (+) Transcript_20026:209-1201(+)